MTLSPPITTTLWVLKDPAEPSLCWVAVDHQGTPLEETRSTHKSTCQWVATKVGPGLGFTTIAPSVDPARRQPKQALPGQRKGKAKA